MLVSSDRDVINFTAAVHVPRRNESRGFVVHSQLHVTELGEKRQRIRGFRFVRMREPRLEGPSVRLGPQMIMNDCLPVQRNQNRWHLVLLRPLVECEWNDFFLAMAVQKNLLSEIPYSTGRQ